MMLVLLILGALSVTTVILFCASQVKKSADDKPAFRASGFGLEPMLRRRAISKHSRESSGAFNQAREVSRQRKVSGSVPRKVSGGVPRKVSGSVTRKVSTDAPVVSGELRRKAPIDIQQAALSQHRRNARDGKASVEGTNSGTHEMSGRISGRPYSTSQPISSQPSPTKTRRPSLAGAFQAYTLQDYGPQDYGAISEQIGELLDARKLVERSGARALKEELQAQTRKDLADINTSLWSVKGLIVERDATRNRHKLGVLPQALEQLRRTQFLWTAHQKAAHQKAAHQKSDYGKIIAGDDVAVQVHTQSAVQGAPRHTS